MRQYRFVWVALTFGTLVSLAACGYGATATATTGGATGASGYGYDAPTSGASGAASPATTGTAPVDVKLSEFKIDMPGSIAAGVTDFRVTNTGTTIHNFEVSGNGIEKQFDTNLKPGETQSLRLELKPGTYTIYCPVGTHKDKGMQVDLVVR